MTRSPFAPVAILLLALGGCGDDDALDGDAGTDQGLVDVDMGPPECLAESQPTPTAGECEAVIADDEASLPVGDDASGGYIVPGAARVTRVGETVELGGFPLSMEPVPGTGYAIVTDGGVAAETLSVVDLETMTVVDQRLFRRTASEATYLGVDTTSDGSKVFVSGGGSNFVWVYGFDTATGQLTDEDPLELAALVEDGYVGDIELLADDRTLMAVLLLGSQVVWWDTETDSEIARLPLIEESRPFALTTNADESRAYVSLWDEAVVVPIDVAGHAMAGEPIPTGKNPEGLALSPDGATLVVADSDSDSLSLIDVTTGMRTRQLYIVGENALRGSSPAEVTFGPDGRLYVVNAGENAVDVFEAETYERVGRIPTMWYPTDVVVVDDAASPVDGAVLVLNGKHEGTGANIDPGTDDILDLVGGSLIRLDADAFTDADLAVWDLEIADNNTRARDFLDVDCGGAAYDFPIPQPGTGPSAVIEHVVLVVRENKTYDAYFGDLRDESGEPHGNGDPDLILLPADEIEDIIPNTRKLALDFAMGDNYYSLAEQSVQGHIRTTWGRTTDFVERSWLTTWGRGYWGVPPQGTSTPMGYPEEGSAFDYFSELGIEQDNFGEIISARNQAPDGRYPGIVYNMGVSDVEKAEWIEGQVQVRCRLKDFTYVLMPNDHTFGRQAGRPTPKAMMADNDAGVGRLVEAISHSTFWPSTVIFVIEDDPQNGGDHVDNHRAPLQVISPWVKRGYVSSVHYNESSIYRTIQLILGIDEPLNAGWANASPMVDLFTSSPDYTPYEAIERIWPEESNPDDGMLVRESAQWDFSVPDEQPGLSRLLWRHLRGTEPPWSPREELIELIEEAGEEEDE